MHPRCRSTVALYIESASRRGTRIAKVGKDTIQIPAPMSYRDYESDYVKKTQTFEQWHKAKPKAVKSSKPRELTLQPKDAINYKDFEKLQNYWATNYGVKLNKPLDRLDFEAVSEATQGIEAVIAESPKAGKFLKKMTVKNLDSAFMCAEYEGNIVFSKSDFIDCEGFLDVLAAQVEYDDNPKNTKIKGVAAHEKGTCWKEH